MAATCRWSHCTAQVVAAALLILIALCSTRVSGQGWADQDDSMMNDVSAPLECRVGVHSLGSAFLIARSHQPLPDAVRCRIVSAMTGAEGPTGQGSRRRRADHLGRRRRLLGRRGLLRLLHGPGCQRRPDHSSHRHGVSASALQPRAPGLSHIDDDAAARPGLLLRRRGLRGRLW